MNPEKEDKTSINPHLSELKNILSENQRKTRFTEIDITAKLLDRIQLKEPEKKSHIHAIQHRFKKVMGLKNKFDNNARRSSKMKIPLENFIDTDKDIKKFVKQKFFNEKN